MSTEASEATLADAWADLKLGEGAKTAAKPDKPAHTIETIIEAIHFAYRDAGEIRYAFRGEHAPRLSVRIISTENSQWSAYADNLFGQTVDTSASSLHEALTALAKRVHEIIEKNLITSIASARTEKERAEKALAAYDRIRERLSI